MGKRFEVKSLALKGMCEHSGHTHGRTDGDYMAYFCCCFVGFGCFIFQRKKTTKRKNYKAHGDIWSGRGRVEGKGEVKRGEEIELFPLLFEVIVIFYFRSPKVQKLSLEKPIFVIFVSIAIYIKRIQNLEC